MDVFTPDKRSAVMRAVKSKDTSAELVVRRLLFAHGYRYRVHYVKLPGKPDVAFPGRKKAVLVHGCFWHQHTGCPQSERPASNSQYWQAKLDRNIARDERNAMALARLGWDVLVVWECEIRTPDALLAKLNSFLQRTPHCCGPGLSGIHRMKAISGSISPVKMTAARGTRWSSDRRSNSSRSGLW